MKIIDLLNKIAKGEEVPNKIKYKCDTYVVKEDPLCKDVKYKNEKKDIDGYSKHLFQDWIIDAILNDEIEIIEEVEDKEYEDIEPIIICMEEQGELVDKINALIRNQKYILEQLENK